ncbi:MAG: homoserine O-succinyltransferase [Alphaproteobacteria bacterium]|nr:homoserine O-succinyltransferase [Alphaproteobacteria bacterium]
MPLVQHSDLPTFERLRLEGRDVLPEGRAFTQDIRELHIGFCNMMPDAALEAAERQFFRLVGESNKIAQFYIHPFTLPVVERSDKAKAYFNQYYEPLETIMDEGLDALIITGASEESNPKVSDKSYWKPLLELLEWSHQNVTSTLCSCLASHAAVTYKYGQEPSWQDDKCFGIFSHRVADRGHPLARCMNTVFNAPHARHNQITASQFREAGLSIVAESEEAGVHAATSRDGIRLVCFQGHPEYDTFSLLKEYRREIEVFREGGRPDYPTFPKSYFNPEAAEFVLGYQSDVEAGKDPGPFPEEELAEKLDNTWTDSARAMIANWIGAVYQITDVDRRKPFMQGVNPEDPFGLYS